MGRLAVYMQDSTDAFRSVESSAIVGFGGTFERYQSMHPQATVVDWRIAQSITARSIGEKLARVLKAATI